MPIEIEITDEMREVAAKSCYEAAEAKKHEYNVSAHGKPIFELEQTAWEDLEQWQRDIALDILGAGLAVAAPLLADQVLEQAAQVAENYHKGLHPATGWTDKQKEWWETGSYDTSSAIAAAIRSLSNRSG